MCALVAAPSAAKAVLDTLLALPQTQGKRGGRGPPNAANSRNSSVWACPGGVLRVLLPVPEVQDANPSTQPSSVSFVCGKDVPAM